jgi:hypothetical protein
LKKIIFGILGVILILVVFASNVSNKQNTQANFNGYSVKIIASGPWTGTISDASGSRSVMGTGNQTFQLSSYPGMVFADFQKDGSKDRVDINGTLIPNNSQLTVQLLS